MTQMKWPTADFYKITRAGFKAVSPEPNIRTDRNSSQSIQENVGVLVSSSDYSYWQFALSQIFSIMRKLNKTASQNDAGLIYDLRRPSPIETPDIHILICLHRLRDVDCTQESQLENASQVTDASIKVTHGKKYEPTIRLIKTFLINERQLPQQDYIEISFEDTTK